MKALRLWPKTGLIAGFLLVAALSGTPAALADEEPGPERSYGGRATGPAELPTLPKDPAYPVPKPVEAIELPPELDETPSWQPNLRCDPVDRPGLEAFGTLIGAHYDRPGYTTSRSCLTMRSEHYDGRAIDWQLDAFDPMDRRIGDAVVQWLAADEGEMATRFGIQSLIWNERVWHNDGRGWQGYTGQSPHTDHVHFSFTWDGAMMRTSWWTGVAVTEPDPGPCLPAPTRLPRAEGATDDETDADADADADADDATSDAAAPPTAVAPTPVPHTWVLRPQACLPGVQAQSGSSVETEFTEHKHTILQEGDRGPAVAVLQRALRVEDDGIFGPQTAKAVDQVRQDHPWLEEGQEVSALMWHLLERRAHPTLPYRTHELTLGDESGAVAMAQRFLGVEDDGIFGPITQTAVEQIQREAGLAVTGTVNPQTWAAFEDHG